MVVIPVPERPLWRRVGGVKVHFDQAWFRHCCPPWGGGIWCFLVSALRTSRRCDATRRILFWTAVTAFNGEV